MIAPLSLSAVVFVCLCRGSFSGSTPHHRRSYCNPPRCPPPCTPSEFTTTGSDVPISIYLSVSRSLPMLPDPSIHTLPHGYRPLRFIQKLLWAFPKILAFSLVAGTHYQFLWYIFRVFLPGNRQLCQLSRLVQPSQYADILTQKVNLRCAKLCYAMVDPLHAVLFVPLSAVRTVRISHVCHSV